MIVAEIVNLEQGGSIDRAGLQPFVHIADRERLSPTSLKAFLQLTAKWSLPDSEAGHEPAENSSQPKPGRCSHPKAQIRCDVEWGRQDYHPRTR
jgi:hypothetical protein